MEGKNKTRLILALAFLACLVPVHAQNKSEQKDSLVRLISASSLQLENDDEHSFRKTYNATFLHNDTYLICDTAIWDVGAEIINAWGNVQVVQDETILTSDQMDYYIQESVVRFRGPIVQLQNKQKNTLRTRHLDYNTRDSVAVFEGGAAMQDEEGQIIESLNGTYDSTTKLFTFEENVNMFTDSVFLKTEKLEYDSSDNTAIFPEDIDFWKDNNMLSASQGWYQRDSGIFFFTDKVHGLTENQEIWCDSLYVWRNVGEVMMLSNAQVQDTSRKVAAVADRIFYQDSLSRIKMWDQAAVALETKQEDNKKQIDTLYFGGDTLIYTAVKYIAVKESEKADAKSRLMGFAVDPVKEYRDQAAAKAEQERKQKMEELGLDEPEEEESAISGRVGTGGRREGLELESRDGRNEPPQTGPAGEEIARPQAGGESRGDDVIVEGGKSLEELEAMVQEPEFADSADIGFVEAIGNVKVYRTDIQSLSGRMMYNDLDSIARFFEEPIIWNEGNRQYSADSIYLLVNSGGLDKADLLTGAFIAVKESESLFDQIKGAEIMAYFDSTSALRRFDALGGAQAIFYLEENSELVTANIVNCKIFSANLVKGNLDNVTYFEEPHNDAYPIAQMNKELREMKGFNWHGDLQPTSRYEVTDIQTKESERDSYERHPKAVFRQADIYFPGYMAGIYREIEVRDSLSKLPPPPEEESAIAPESEEAEEETVEETVESAEETVGSEEEGAGTVETGEEAEAAEGEEGVEGEKVEEENIEPTAWQLREEERRRRRAEQDLKDSLKLAEREAKWARLDSLDAAKEAARKAKALEKQRNKTRRLLKAKARQEERDRKKFERYVARYQKQKALKEAREQKKKLKQLETDGKDN